MKNVRISLGLLLGLGLVLVVASAANAQTFMKTYTWTLVESPGALGLWPNEVGAPSIFEADEGLLGRVVTLWTSNNGRGDMACTAAGTPFACCTGFQTGPTCDDMAYIDNNIVNFCQVAQGYPCDISNYQCTGVAAPAACCTGLGTGTCTGPPAMMFGSSGVGPSNHEGPFGGTGALINSSECNKTVSACGTMPLAPGTHTPGTDGHSLNGTYSFLALHKTPTGKGISFLSGSYTVRQAFPDCNGCPPTGRGRDRNNVADLSRTAPDMIVETTNIALWTTQGTPFAGHDLLSLGASTPADAGQGSLCGNGIVFQDVVNDLCANQPTPGTPNFTIPDQKVVYSTYSVNMAKHANFANKEKCNPPGCYIERVIIPAAMAQSGNLATAVQVQKATSVLPSTAPLGLGNATVDTIIFAYTTQAIDLDSDGLEDWDDPCPGDPLDGCLADQINGGNCAAGLVFCADANGDLGCIDPWLCNYRLNVDNDGSCLADVADESILKGSGNGVGGAEAFNTGAPVGPFNP